MSNLKPNWMGYSNGKNQGKNLNLVVYPNDHLPPHVHVLGPGWKIRLSINGKLEVMTITGKPKLQEITQAIEATSVHIAELNKIWSDLHDVT